MARPFWKSLRPRASSYCTHHLLHSHTTMSTPGTCPTPCANCNRKGLPLLFTRYGVAYSRDATHMAALKQLAPGGNLRAHPGGVALKNAAYNLRMLRPGYLYVHVKRSAPVVADAWKGYVVHPHGYLSEFNIDAPAQAKPHKACAVDDRPSNMSLVWVDAVKTVEKVYYVFSADPMDPEHFNATLKADPAKYMQAFDVSGWADGNKAQKDSTQPGQLNTQVMEFAALKSETVRDASESLLYGVMGSSLPEREWGQGEVARYWEVNGQRWFEELPSNAVVAQDGAQAVERPPKGKFWVMRGSPVPRDYGNYKGRHGSRLDKMAELLQAKGGAVVACEDSFGIAQELGHQQTEAAAGFPQWQIEHAAGLGPKVSNEWAFQTAFVAQNMRETIKKGLVAKSEAHAKRAAEYVQKTSLTSQPMRHPNESTQEYFDRIETHRKALVKSQKDFKEKQQKAGLEEMDNKWTELFDQQTADAVTKARQSKLDETQALQNALGQDHVAWLGQDLHTRALALYNTSDKNVASRGGAVELAQAAALAISHVSDNAVGHRWLADAALTGNTLMALTLSGGNKQLQINYANAANAPILVAPDPSTPIIDWLTEKLKIQSSKLALSDKFIGFMEAYPAISESGFLKKNAWLGTVGSLLGLKTMQTISGLPATQVEARIASFLALQATATLGSTAQQHAKTIGAAVKEAERLNQAAQAIQREARTMVATRALGAVPGSRSALLGASFDMLFGLFKGIQTGVKRDLRTSTEMVSQTLQAIGSVLDYRAKAYEETIYKGVRGMDVYRDPTFAVKADALQVAHLRSLRIAALKFLAPAAAISMALDIWDARTNSERGLNALSRMQYASAFGTALALAGSYTLVMEGGSLLANIIIGMGATITLIGAVIAVVTTIAVMYLKEADWLVWLKDNPLNKERQGKDPIHKNLWDTLQAQANAVAALN